MKLSFHHTAISVRDLTKSLEFYAKLGFKQVHRYDEPDGSMSIIHILLGQFYLELFHFSKNSSAESLQLEYANNLTDIGVKHIALKVDDIESALAELRELGLANQDTEITEGRTKVSYFFIKDPDGVWVEFVKDERY